jgi:tRNA pseudouridine38-40 synthase
MSVWALLVEYDGAPFVGWQRQRNGFSVQQVIEDAAARLSGEVSTIAAGRTDAGVHAAGQVVELHLDREISPDRLREALNYHLKPHPVSVLQTARAPPGWTARFSASRRTYRYLILNRRARPALMAGQVWHVPHPLDAEAMHEAAQSLLGQHDFSSFRAASCQASGPLRTLDRLEVLRRRDVIEIWAEARSFLHHQVRNIAGSLRLVGDGTWPVTEIARVLAAKDRRVAGPTAPAEGLCLMRVGYPNDPFPPQS